VRLITAHRILIGAGIVFFVFYAVITLVHGHTPAALAQAAIALAVAVGLVLYYRTLKRWGSRPPS
jgi:hypothetical protein